MVMEFDQYLQPCDVLDGRYLAAVDPRTSKPQPPRLDLYRAAGGGSAGIGTQSTAAAASSKASEPASDQDAGGGSPTDNRCTWECNFDNDDAETILTSETVSFIRLLLRPPHHLTRGRSMRSIAMRVSA